MNRNEIGDRISALLAQSLALRTDDVHRHSRVITDLGADSLDFIDLTFSIEKEFGITLRDGEMDFLSQLDFSSPDFMRNGYLTPEALEKLRPWLTAIGEVEDPSKVTPAQLFSFITVETLCLLVERKLSEG